MLELELTFHTTFINWNQIALMCYSRDRNAYSRNKRRETLFATNEIKKQLKDMKNYFPEGAVKVLYEWHTTRRFDLGNLIAGEKVIDDVINSVRLWSDDSQITHVSHQRIADNVDYVRVVISNNDDPENIGFKRNQSHDNVKYSIYFQGKCIGTYNSIRGVCNAINAKPAQVQKVLDGVYRTVKGCEVREHG